MTVAEALYPQFKLLFGTDTAYNIEVFTRQKVDCAISVPYWVTEKLNDERRVIDARTKVATDPNPRG